MSVIISIAHQKGGVGKTTLSMNLAAFYTRQGINTALLDADMQGSIYNLVEALKDRPGFEPFKVFSAEEVPDFSKLEELEYDLIIIDTPPYLSDRLPSIFDHSNFVLVPCKASPLDIQAIGGTLPLIQEAQERNENLTAGIVINMGITNAKFTADCREALGQYDFPILENEIMNRTKFASSIMDQGHVFGAGDPKAEKEIELLGWEIYNTLTGKEIEA